AGRKTPRSAGAARRRSRGNSTKSADHQPLRGRSVARRHREWATALCLPAIAACAKNKAGTLSGRPRCPEFRRWSVWGELAFHRLQRLALDLANPFGGHAILVGQVLQRRGIVLAQPARLDDVPAAIVELRERPRQAFRAIPRGLVALEDLHGLVVGVGQPRNR